MIALPDDPLLLATGGILLLLALVAGGFIVVEVLRLIRDLLAGQPKLPVQRSFTGDDLLRGLTHSTREEPVVEEDRGAVSALIDRVDDEGGYINTPPD
jgi:hypothetical protein